MALLSSSTLLGKGPCSVRGGRLRGMDVWGIHRTPVGAVVVDKMGLPLDDWLR